MKVAYPGKGKLVYIEVWAMKQERNRQLFTESNLDQVVRLRSGVPRGTRTPVFGVRGRCPGPLDDGDIRPLLIVARTAIKKISN